ncbi:hypothetical protein [Paenibacillus sp. NPDC058177]|uniref:hypothetical protein n=1 Tax=Paenibacillus sp. NPDC058177 TaxID=3346369 RepID=UPI0036DA8292
MLEASLTRGLHSLARRYCITKIDYWGRKYSRLIDQGRDREPDGIDHSLEAKKLFPRYIVLKAILAELERYIPEDFDSFSEARFKITQVINEAVSFMTKANDDDNVTRNTMSEERSSFVSYLENVSAAKVMSQPPLFYRRKLSVPEIELLWTQLNDIWAIKTRGPWIPLDGSQNELTLAFMDDYFDSEVGYELLRKFLKEHGVNHVYELRELEFSPEYELELSAFTPTYAFNGEGFWCSKEMDWVIYASHENSITIGGEWLINKVKEVWSNWESRLWLDWEERLERGI